MQHNIQDKELICTCTWTFRIAHVLKGYHQRVRLKRQLYGIYKTFPTVLIPFKLKQTKFNLQITISYDFRSLLKSHPLWVTLYNSLTVNILRIPENRRIQRRRCFAWILGSLPTLTTVKCKLVSLFSKSLSNQF